MFDFVYSLFSPLIYTCCLASVSSVLAVIQSSKKFDFLFWSTVVPDPSFVLAAQKWGKATQLPSVEVDMRITDHGCMCVTKMILRTCPCKYSARNDCKK